LARLQTVHSGITFANSAVFLRELCGEETVPKGFANAAKEIDSRCPVA
jgi:hypothetical protein